MKTFHFLLSVFLFASFCSAQLSAGQFSYKGKGKDLEIAFNQQPAFMLDSTINKIAFGLNKHLNDSPLFDAKLLYDAQRTRDYHLKKKHLPDNIGRIYSLTTRDGIDLEMTHFDRGSDTLLVVGGGFTNNREVMSPFIHMFPDYDIVLFDFRGHGYDESTWWNPLSWSWSFSKYMFGVESEEVGLGSKEHDDVFAVVEKCKSLKSYNQVFGVGVCYSAFVFLKSACLASRQGVKLFDKLILDSCWLSLPLFIEKVKKDPKTIVDPQYGGLKDHWLWTNSRVQDAGVWMAENIFWLELHDESLLHYVKDLKDTSLLFFFGKDDLMVARDEFELLWNALPQSIEKTAVITTYPHVRNHLKAKESYKLISDLFFEESQENLKTLLSDSKELIGYYKRKLDGLLIS